MKLTIKILKYAFMAFIALAITVCVIGTIYITNTIRQATPIDTQNIYNNINQASTVYDKNENVIDTLYLNGENRIIISIDEMPDDLLNAITTIEDKTFWEHHGFNGKRLLGAIYYALKGGEEISGTSTITQQLARNIYLPDIKFERSIKRKLVEAYYTIILERTVDKREILEAYLNTVYFGYGSYGIEQAAQNYFGKHAKDLNTFECVTLAAMPQSPSSYALVFTDSSKTKGYEELKVRNGVHFMYNGNASETRRKTIIENMYKNGLITKEKKEKLLKKDLKKALHIKYEERSNKNNYFIDYAIKNVKSDLMKEYKIDEDEADRMIYQGGLEIYTTLDQKIQKKLQKQIDDGSNYTSLKNVRHNEHGDIINSSGGIMLVDKNDIITDKGNIKIKKGRFKKKKNGNLLIKNTKYITISNNEIYLNSMYEYDKYGDLCIINSGHINIPANYIKINKDNDIIIQKGYVNQKNSGLKVKHGNLYISKNIFTLEPSIRQPQAAGAIIENKTGKIVAMSGGSTTNGRNTFNRATAPHQTGSSIKPLSVYAPALQKSADAVREHKELVLDTSRGDIWGDYITAGSIINDARMITNGKIWPQNVTRRYSGKITFRKAVEQSVNTAAVKTLQQVGLSYSIKKLKANGISSLIEEGQINDKNWAALALGGQSHGVSPLEMSAAYRSIATDGKYIKPKTYTKVKDRNGKILLKARTKETRVFDKGVAFIMRDILRTAVERGTGTNARIYSQPVAGKTGTTSDQYDIWFAGFTPQYSMALWEGADVHFELGESSGTVASFWGKIMEDICSDNSYKNFPDAPKNVDKINGEWYTKGTK